MILYVLKSRAIIVASIPVKALLCCKPMGNRFNKVFFAAQINALVVTGNTSAPCFVSAVPTNPLYSAGVSGKQFGISNIALPTSLPKIAPFVIGLIPIYMVNHVFGSVAVHVDKSKSVSEVDFSKNINSHVSQAGCPGYVVFSLFDDSALGINPSKNASVRVVMQDFFEFCLGDHGVISSVRDICRNIGCGKLIRFQRFGFDALAT